MITDSTGHADIIDGSREQLLITVKHIGFQPVEIHVSGTDDADTFVIALAPAAVVLAPTITVASAIAKQLETVGFYDRKRIRAGTFLDSAAIAAAKPLDLLSVLGP